MLAKNNGIAKWRHRKTSFSSLFELDFESGDDTG